MSYFYDKDLLVITPGARVRRAGTLRTRKTSAIVSIRRTEPARNGKTRVFWKSNGRIASTLI